MDENNIVFKILKNQLYTCFMMDEMLSTHRLDFMIPTGRCEIQIKCARDQLIVLNFHDWIIVHKAVELTNKRSPDSFLMSTGRTCISAVRT